MPLKYWSMPSLHCTLNVHPHWMCIDSNRIEYKFELIHLMMWFQCALKQIGVNLVYTAHQSLCMHLHLSTLTLTSLLTRFSPCSNTHTKHNSASPNPIEATGPPYMLPAEVVETTPGQRCPSPDQWAAAREKIYEEAVLLAELEYGARPGRWLRQNSTHTPASGQLTH